MRFKQYIDEMVGHHIPRQKFAFAAVREILSAGLKGAKVDTIKQNKILKIKMPDRATSSIHKGSTGMEFTVDVESKN